MDANELARPDAPAPSIGESRSRVLAALQDAGEAMGVDEVARRVRLHPNTVRFHLDALVEAGLVERSTEHRDQPGRPRTMYAAHPGSARAGRRSYRLLAEILSSYVGSQMPEPARAGREAGRAWGRYLAERPPPFRQLDADSATERLVGTLDDIGFAPEAATTGRDRQILLHHCPFRETASEHREIVCSIHLGLMQGILAELGAPIDADRLEPFVEPSLCIAHLAAKRRDTERPHDQPA
ncbi:MAG: helix-turn-helix transcriptional regulator [Actinomycetota bacterium]